VMKFFEKSAGLAYGLAVATLLVLLVIIRFCGFEVYLTVIASSPETPDVFFLGVLKCHDGILQPLSWGSSYTSPPGNGRMNGVIIYF
jgi:hypothetical protein